MIEEVKKLEGQEMSFLQLDNRMIELGYFSVFGSGAEHNIPRFSPRLYIKKLKKVYIRCITFLYMVIIII